MQYINYRETRQRGTADFPLEFHHVTSTHPQYLMSFHWHVEFEIIRILKGTFTLTLDEQEVCVSEGSTIFIPAGSLHAGIPSDGCIYECIVFDLNMLMNKSDTCCHLIRQILNHEIELLPVYTPSYDNIHLIAWSLFDAMATKNPGYELLVQGALYQFFGTIFSRNYYSDMPTQTPRDHKRILPLKQALEFIESSYTLPLSLQEISESVGMSPKYFCRFFQEMTHRTPIDYLNYYRIERACYHLLTTNLSITEVAFSSGFNDLSYFIKTFKKYKGTTPKKYLKS